MIKSTLAANYLARLEAAISDLPHGIAVELRDGITEEFDGLNDHAAASRIARLGTPEQVAAEARASAEAPPETPTASAARLPLRETRGYAILSLVLFGIGSFLVPVLGTIAGGVLVCTSRMWSTREKLWALLSPFVAVVLALVIGVITQASSSSSSGNPLVPAFYDGTWSAVLLGGFIVAPLAALWLFLRIIRK